MSLIVRLDALARGPLREARELQTGWCAIRIGPEWAPASDTFQVELELKRAAGVVEATCRVRGALRFGCSRCGDGLEFPLDVRFQHRFVPAGELDLGPMDPDDALFVEDPDVSEHDDVSVDLEPLCIEHVIVELPQAPSCVHTAAGACPQWSEEPAVYGDVAPEVPEESPWAALRQIRAEDAKA